MIAAGNIGCITQIGQGTDIPILHTIELIDWAYGGPVPSGAEKLKGFMKDVPGPSPEVRRTPSDFMRA